MCVDGADADGVVDAPVYAGLLGAPDAHRGLPPRISAKRSECCRASPVVNHSTFSPPPNATPWMIIVFLNVNFLPKAGQRFSVINDGRSPGK